MTEKEVKNLNKHLVLAIDWAAAEYKYIKELKEELEEINEEKNVRKEVKEIAKAIRILRWVGRAERRAADFEKSVDEELKKTLQGKLVLLTSGSLKYGYNQLTPHVGEDIKRKQSLIQAVRKVLKQLEIEHGSLVKYASMYEGLLREELQKSSYWSKEESKYVLKAEILDDVKNTRKANLIHSSLLKLIQKIQREVGDVEEWVSALEATLKRAQELSKQLIEEGQALQEGLSIMHKYGWYLSDDNEITLFVAQHLVDLKKMVRATGRGAFGLFRVGLPILPEHLFTEQYWPGLVKMIVDARENAKDCLFHGTGAVQNLINERTWPMFVDGLPKISRAAGKHSVITLHSLKAVENLINERTWPMFVDGFPKIANASGEYAQTVLSGIYDLNSLINERTWPMFVDGLPKIARATPGNHSIYENILEVWDVINEKTWPKIIKIIEVAGRKSTFLFNYVLKPLVPYIKSGQYTWQEVEHFIFEFIKVRNVHNLTILFSEKCKILIKNLDLNGLINLSESLKDDKRYWDIQGLNELGFLSVHVTNAFGGGAALNVEETRRSDPFENIITCITNQGTRKFQLSFSTIKPNAKLSIAMTERYGIKGSIGVILDAGYIYESYSTDSNTITKKTHGVGLGYRTGPKKVMIESKMAVHSNVSGYNELLTRRWTVGGLFYTKGVQRKHIKKLKMIANEYSFKGYINPKWIYRKVAFGIPKHAPKIFPIYEINPRNNTWRIVYTPKRS